MYEVLHYLYARVCRSGSEQEHLPGEIELCRKFGYSRGTVQRALAALESNGYLCRLPGRRGFYTNPGLVGTIPWSIGIVVNSGIAGILDDIDSSALSSFIRKMTSARLSPLLFHMISVETLKQLENTLCNHGIRALLWISPSPESIPFFEGIVEHGLPAVAVMSPYYHSGKPFPAFNALKQDYQANGRHLAKFIMEQGLKRPLFCGISGVTSRSLFATLAEHGIQGESGQLIEDERDFEKKLLGLWTEGQFDCIVLNGGPPRYNTVINLLREQRELAGTPLIVQNDSTTQRYRVEFPEFNVLFISRYSSNDYMIKSGKKAADMLLNLIQSPGMKIPSACCTL